jgi:4'-phosphopantetheinyl transferase
VREPIVRVCRVEDVTVDAGWLTVEETVRWQRFARPADRDAYLAAHILVRLVAAELAGADPAELTLSHECPDCGPGDHGRPTLTGLDLHVSLSHTRGWVAAIAADARCGIDVEPVGTVPDRALTEGERDWAGSDAVRRTRLWSRKEALAKAGLADVMDFWGVDARDPDGVVDWTAPDGSAVAAWVLGRS